MLVFIFFFVFGFWTVPVLSVFNISIVSTIQPVANGTGVRAVWTREASDPAPHRVQKVKTDAVTKHGKPFEFPTTLKFNSTIDGSALSGQLNVSFIRAGIFRLDVYDANNELLGSTPDFGVNAPLSFQNFFVQPDAAVVSPPTASPIANLSNMASPSPSATDADNDNDSSPKSHDKDHSGMSPALIVAVVVVTLLLVFCIIGILFFVLRRRLRHQKWLKERNTGAGMTPDMITRVGANGGSGLTSPTAPGVASFYNYGNVDLEKGNRYAVRRTSMFSGSQYSFDPSAESGIPSSYAHATEGAEHYGSGKRRRFPSVAYSNAGTVSTIQFNPQTERQIALEERIWELEAQADRLRKEAKTPTTESGESTTSSNNDLRLWKIKGQIETLRTFKESPWALGTTDEIPPGLYFQ